MSVSLKRIAEMAGVSPSTVSRVVNGTAKVSGETRNAILDAAALLGVEPIMLRKGRRVLNIALVSRKDTYSNPNLASNYFYSSVLRGMEDTANDLKCNLLMATATEEDILAGHFPTPIRTGSVDGILMTGYMPEEAITMLQDTGLPLVCVDTRGPGETPCVMTDNVGGARAVVKHLVEVAGPDVVVVSGPASDCSFEERIVGYRCALAELGITYSDDRVHRLSRASMQESYEAAANICRNEPRGIFCTNDELALGVLRYLNEQGVRVPDRVAMAGFDDIQMSSHVHPTLTTVHTHKEYMGGLGLTKLVNIIKGSHKEPGTALVATELIVRGSTVVA